MAPLLAAAVGTLLQNGLTILGNAVLSKGKDVVEEKLGVKIDDMLGSPEGLMKLKELEYEHEEVLKQFILATRELELREGKMYLEDTQNARERESRMNESAYASDLSKNITSVLALIVVFGGGWLFHTNKDDAATQMAVVGVVTMVLSYYFGTSRTSAMKDTSIETLTRNQK